MLRVSIVNETQTKRLIADALNYIASRVCGIRSRWNYRGAVSYGNQDVNNTPSSIFAQANKLSSSASQV